MREIHPDVETQKSDELANCFTRQMAALEEGLKALKVHVTALEAGQNNSSRVSRDLEPQECRERRCGFYTHYLSLGPPELTHEGYPRPRPSVPPTRAAAWPGMRPMAGRAAAPGAAWLMSGSVGSGPDFKPKGEGTVTTCFVRSGRKRKPESEFQSTVIQYLQIRYGARVWILNHPGGLGQRSGVPDLLICLDGRFLALEIKSPLGTGRLGPRQQEELEAIRQAGGVAAVISSWKELEKALSELEEAKR